ncbi:hypothetical protein StrepF001_44535 [Streptomyces sp. F001]|uniref:hypothetical protein n=1 Tax=Streptomyces sp. F001 TaxID=1510026 RepID=UPI00101E2F55|nr:hypothetical protein [Streptomyces sp. F001]RZB13373.1 hypothetical protein StrepF001_44535 [Streptomyces sp. F001]
MPDELTVRRILGDQPFAEIGRPVWAVADARHGCVIAALPGYSSCSWRDEEGQLKAVGLWTSDGSTAVVDVSGAVRQYGPQRLWDTVEDLAKAFDDEPARDDFRLTTTPTRQVVSYGGVGGPSWVLPTHP